MFLFMADASVRALEALKHWCKKFVSKGVAFAPEVFGALRSALLAPLRALRSSRYSRSSLRASRKKNKNTKPVASRRFSFSEIAAFFFLFFTLYTSCMVYQLLVYNSIEELIMLVVYGHAGFCSWFAGF